MRPYALPCAVLLLLLLGGCGGKPAAPATAGAAPQEAVARRGDVTVRASALQTSALSPAVAAQYGLNRDDGTVMLLVAVRRGPDGQEVAMPAQVSATVSDLRGQRHNVEFRELRTGDAASGGELLDYVGTVEIDPPDTLRFEISAVGEGGASATLEFSREFYPR
ncbi:DUF4426 domain-containing protein [Lysobacter silvisoli]|uniref:DUF4426 domain-containing protein n=1 Tax=Lysobacter silvisoli TaxID=2293254 RepID=A0A371K636_9GAMM|nr:DUF4426 domain-containing protein [Lysobacter silvisoli]RDZ29409.1 DUF4426 domain-containing protein [Lysobacter silvisoli]